MMRSGMMAMMKDERALSRAQRRFDHGHRMMEQGASAVNQEAQPGAKPQQ